jgi:energy-coupling factor transporter ATP-binding protein EcfA2
MRTLFLNLCDFRGVSGRIPLSDTVVLFGANDSGKTNMLDAIQGALLLEEPPRTDVRDRETLFGPDQAHLTVELPDLHIPGSRDQELFYAWSSSELHINFDEHEELLSGLWERVEEVENAGWLRSSRATPIASYVTAYVDALRKSGETREETLTSSIFRLGYSIYWIKDPDDVFGVFLGGADDLLVDELSLGEPTGSHLPLARVVRPRAGAWDDLAKEVELFIRRKLRIDIDWLRPPKWGTAAHLEQLESGREHWLERREDGWFRVHSDVASECARLSEASSELAPEFIRARYRIAVIANDPDQWRRAGRVSVLLVPHGGTSDEGYDLARSSSAMATWSGYAVAEVLRRAYSELEDRPGAASPLQTVYLIDEPEQHLHPRAQEEVATWLTNLSRPGASVILATHALPFLALPSQNVEYLLISRRRDRSTSIESITSDVWGALDRRVREAGLGSRAQLIQLARAFLIVEGAHDEAVIRHFYREQLERERIVVLPARGAQKAKSLIEAELLAMIEAPMIILFDDIRAHAVVAATTPPSKKDVAAYAVWEMLRHWPPERKQPHVVSFELPDIYCALPDECVRQIVKTRKGSFSGWQPIIDSFSAEATTVGFKSFFLKKCGLPAETDTTELLSEILERCRRPARDELNRGISETLERARSSSGIPELIGTERDGPAH